MTDISLWGYVANAGFIVKCVMLILFSASLASWSIIFERFLFYKKQWEEINHFEKEFWSDIALHDLFQGLRGKTLSGLSLIFHAGFQEFLKLQDIQNTNRQIIVDNTQRAMQIAQTRETDHLEWALSLLATIGAVSPYIGLFGTVWGIMTAFHALGTVQQASIAMVAPGISEALIATAIGLFAAIPAVIAYNRFNNQVSRIQSYYDTFEAELTNILERQIQRPPQ